MAIRCGFFNSVNDDRLYQADDMTKPYELLVSNGVFATQQGTPSNYLQVYPEDGLNVRVKAGRGIFFDKWFLSDSDIVLTLPTAEAALPRIDSIVVKVDKSENVRDASIIVKRGTPSSSPKPPEVIRSDYVKEYRLANVSVTPRATTIPQFNIQDTRGMADCGWVTSLIQQVDTSTLYEQWQAGFDEWFNNVKETLSTATLIRSYNSVYNAIKADEKSIPINITQFNRNLDILQVYINGLMLIKDVEYTIVDNAKITLTKGVDIGTPVSFVVYKSIDGTKATSETGSTKINVSTSETGSTKINVSTGEDVLAKFIAAGKGLHTLYVQNGALNVPAGGAYRGIGHITGDTAGWLMIFQASGSVYANYYNESAWRGWRVLYESTPVPLYKSDTGIFPNDGATVNPTKPLDQCQHGWELVFSGYDDSGKQPRDYYVQTVHIPKKSYKGTNWNGESMTFQLVSGYAESSDTISSCVKSFTLYNDRLVSGGLNSKGRSRNIVLRAVYEY